MHERRISKSSKHGADSLPSNDAKRRDGQAIRNPLALTRTMSMPLDGVRPTGTIELEPSHDFELGPGISLGQPLSPREIGERSVFGSSIAGLDPASAPAVESGADSFEPVLGEYIIEKKIGAGGMGQVFRARHRTMDRLVALKVLPRSMSQDPHARERFYAEVRATAKLMHPNIVTAFDAGCYRQPPKGDRSSGETPSSDIHYSDIHYLVMELINGELLSERVSKSGPLSTQEVVDVLVQSASALEYAHGQGIVHRDIKPSNMMLTPNGTLKILDFGLAVLKDQLDMTPEATRAQIVGTVEFMAPEQINAPNTVDHRCDLYSLGATIFYLLTGRPMFSGELIQTALAQVHRKPPALYEVRSDVDIRLDSVFQALVAKSPADRLQSATELTDKLSKLNLLERSAESPVRPELSSLRIMPVRPTDFGVAHSTSQRQLAAVGMELGMISSQVNFVNDEHKIEEVLVDGESLVLPNILFSDGETIAVGSKAASHRVNKPDHIFYGMQRWYGLPLLEKRFGGRQAPPEVLVAAILRQMLVSAHHKLPGAAHAVVNVPACYNHMHRLSTKTACSIAGIELLQLLDKPLAATLAHIEIDSRLAVLKGNSVYSKNFMVAMLSGEACEVSMVRVDQNRVELVGNVGDWKRGMVRWHDRMAKKIAVRLKERFGVNAHEDRWLASKIQRTVERVFDRLRSASNVPFVIEVPGGKFESKLSRDSLPEWVDELPGDMLGYAAELMKRIGDEVSRIDGVLLLGDVRWMPSIKQSLQKLVGEHVPMIPLRSNSLAQGAALQADYLLPPIDTSAPHAVGASPYGVGVIMKTPENLNLSAPRMLAPKGTPLPYQSSRTLRFAKDGKRQPVLQFVEETLLGASTWNKLGSIDLQSAFPGRASSDPLQLRVEIDESGLLQPSVTWLAGNTQVAVPPLGESVLDVVSCRQWHDWLESLMLCNG